MKVKVRIDRRIKADGTRGYQVDLQVSPALRKRVRHPGPKRVAEEWGTRALAALVEGRELPPIEEVSKETTGARCLRDVWQAWKDEVLPQHSPAAQEIRHVQWRRLDPLLGAVPLAAIGGRLDAALTSMRTGERKLSAHTAQQSIKFVTQLCRWAESRGWMERAPRTPKVQVPKPEVIWWKPEEIAKIAAHLNGWARAYFVVSTRCGLRDGELRGLQWGDVDYENGVLHVRRQLDDKGRIRPPKNGKQRNVRLTPDAAEALRSLPKLGLSVFISPKSGKVPINSTTNEQLERACKKAGVRVGGTHSGRRSFATNAYLANLPLADIQSAMGHATPVMTQKYIAAGVGNATSADFDVLDRPAGTTDWHRPKARKRKG